ncbi:hypothetical protein FQN60_009131, partial [Etheostoma spectabile]
MDGEAVRKETGEGGCCQQGVCVGGGVKCLDLKGERLDHRSCEALEVVLKSLHFDFINLQAAQLEENGASSLLDMILYYESTTHLDISDNGSMGTLCWRALAHLIKQPNRLDQICGIDLDARAARAQGTRPHVLPPSEALLHLCVILSLVSIWLPTNDHCPVMLYFGALKSNKALRELHLTNNLLNSYQDALQLGDLLRYNTTLQTLELSSNAVADAGLEELCDGLRWQTAGVKVLLLRSNQITACGMVHLAKALVRNIAPALSAVALAEFLAESRQIQGLDLRQNQVKVGGLMALCLALRINRSLSSLDLDHIAPQEQ